MAVAGGHGTRHSVVQVPGDHHDTQLTSVLPDGRGSSAVAAKAAGDRCGSSPELEPADDVAAAAVDGDTHWAAKSALGTRTTQTTRVQQQLELALAVANGACESADSDTA